MAARSGDYKPNVASLKTTSSWKGEQRYWVYVAIDFAGRVVGKQIEVVKE